MKQDSFPYSYWAKLLGVAIIIVGIVSFVLRYYRQGILNSNELAVGLSWGLVFFFFSKERMDDEMIQGLKFKALARAIIVAFAITQVYNYLFLNWRYNRAQDIILSISAYEFLALTLIIATGSFYYLKYQATITDPE